MFEQLLFPKHIAKFKITAPMGGFANHLRWLILLDDSYGFSLYPNRDRYEIFVGANWPSYENYCASNYTGIEQEVIKEIEQITQEHPTIKVWKFFSIEDKTKFIDELVYPDTRTWQNWLNFEWQLRRDLDCVIFLTHKIKYDISNLPGIYIDIEPNQALKHYIKFNSSLNNKTIDQFKNGVNIYRAELNSVNTEDNLIIQADQIYQSILDPDLYATITQYVGVAGNYDLANYVHKRWFNLHCRAEKEIIQFFTTLYQ